MRNQAQSLKPNGSALFSYDNIDTAENFLWKRIADHYDHRETTIRKLKGRVNPMAALRMQGFQDSDPHGFQTSILTYHL